MPIVPSLSVTRISQEEFKELSFEVMQHVFAIHNEFGRFFDEKVYKKALAERMKDVRLEVPVDVIHETFAKRYYADVMVRNSGLFEFKTTDSIHSKHVAQALHYLLLFDLNHGKIINVRPEKAQHQFVNCHQRLIDLGAPVVCDQEWRSEVAGADGFRDTLMALIRDWGAGLEISLYEEAVTHFLGGEEKVNVPVSIFGTLGHLADQRMRLVAPDVAFKLTSLSQGENAFITHAKKLIEHTSLSAIHWANITCQQVTFSTIK